MYFTTSPIAKSVHCAQLTTLAESNINPGILRLPVHPAATYPNTLILSCRYPVAGLYITSSNTDLLSSRDYQIGQLDDVEDSITHNKMVTLQGGNGVPAGTFNVKYDSSTGITSLYQGGKEVYGMYVDPRTNKKVITPIKKD